ncbi:hypothetical protein C0585_06220 [Candidatus Woesearchaeota archaeon]|nr:MAG: hypothetical protein C0585_06220 [Candidatus Woesearchaeota archaeon]
MEKILLERNIKLYYMNRFFRQFVLFLPVWALFFQEVGLSLAQITIAATLMHVTIQILEVPSGIFADLYGRKKSVFLSALFFMLSILSYSFAYNFIHLLLGEILMGISFAFSSGAIQAMIYDSLYDLNKKNNFKKVESHSFFISGISHSIAAIIGGFIAVYSLRLTFFYTLIPGILLFLTNILFYEPEHHKTVGDKDYLKHYKEAWNFTKKHKKILFLMFYNASYIILTLAFFIILQPYMVKVGFQLKFFGYLYAFFLFVSALGSKFMSPIEEFLGYRKSMLLIPISTIIGILIVFFSKSLLLSLIGISLFELNWGFLNPLISSYINEHLPTKYRATIISFNGFLIGIGSLIFIPLMGRLGDISLNYSFLLILLMGIIGLAFAIRLGGKNGQN